MTENADSWSAQSTNPCIFRTLDMSMNTVVQINHKKIKRIERMCKGIRYNMQYYILSLITQGAKDPFQTCTNGSSPFSTNPKITNHTQSRITKPHLILLPHRISSSSVDTVSAAPRRRPFQV